MSSDNVQMQWGDIVFEETFLSIEHALFHFECFVFKHFNNFQTKQVLKVEDCFMSESKNQSTLRKINKHALCKY